MTYIPLQPYPGERVRGFWDLFELSSTGKYFWSLATDVPGTVTLEAGDDVWFQSWFSELLRPGDDVPPTKNWILSATSGSVTVEVRQAVGSWDEPGPPAWGPATTVTASPGARGIVPLIDDFADVDMLRQEGTGSHHYPAVRITVIAGSALCDDLALQLEPPGGLLVVAGTHYSDIYDSNPRMSEWPLNFGTTLRSYALTAFTDDFGAGANDALQEAAAVARTGGNSDLVPGLASPVFHSTTGGFSRADNTGPPFHAAVEMFVTYRQVGADISGWRGIPENISGADSDVRAGRDWIFDPTDPTGIGVKWAAGQVTTQSWADQEWMFYEHPNFCDAYVAVEPGTIESAVGTAPLTSTGVDAWGFGHYSGVFPPALGSVIATADETDIGATINVADSAFPASDIITLTFYTEDLVGHAVPVAGGGPFAPGARWDVQIRNNPTTPAAVAFRYWYPDFQYLVPEWAPSPLAVNHLEPRFFVKDHDGAMRPVGYGKPADEEHVFMVPTPVGFYRDMTAAEYAANPISPF